MIQHNAFMGRLSTSLITLHLSVFFLFNGVKVFLLMLIIRVYMQVSPFSLMVSPCLYLARMKRDRYPCDMSQISLLEQIDQPVSGLASSRASKGPIE